MIEVFYWPTPNAHKITMFLEETGLAYRITPLNIATGEQFEPAFLAISPNNRMPAIIDHAPTDGGAPISVFESGAILQYLADKSAQFAGRDPRDRVVVTEWLFWQMANLGPMAGQNHHFVNYAEEKIPYAMARFIDETNRLYGVLNERLQGRQYIAGDDYSIADMACYPWIVPWKRQQQQLDDFAQIRRWFDGIRARPATQRAYALAEAYKGKLDTEAARKILFGQTAASRQQRSAG